MTKLQITFDDCIVIRQYIVVYYIQTSHTKANVHIIR